MAETSLEFCVSIGGTDKEFSVISSVIEKNIDAVFFGADIKLKDISGRMEGRADENEFKNIARLILALIESYRFNSLSFEMTALMDCDYGAYKVLFCRYQNGEALYGEDFFGLDDPFDEEDRLDDIYIDTLQSLRNSVLKTIISPDQNAKQWIETHRDFINGIIDK